MSEPCMRIQNGCLFVSKELSQEFDLAFDAICAQLLDSPQKELMINLGNITYISSAYIGIIAATYFQALALGKTIKVIGGKQILDILKQAGFGGFIKLELSA